MQLQIQGRNFKITDAVQAYVSKKIGNATRHYDNLIVETDVTLEKLPNRNPIDSNLVAVTVYVNGAVLHVEDHHNSLFACIDGVADKVRRQLETYKSKRNCHA